MLTSNGTDLKSVISTKLLIVDCLARELSDDVHLILMLLKAFNYSYTVWEIPPYFVNSYVEKICTA